MTLQSNITAPRIIALPPTKEAPLTPRGIHLGAKASLPLDAKLYDELKKIPTFQGWVKAGEVSVLNPVS